MKELSSSSPPHKPYDSNNKPINRSIAKHTHPPIFYIETSTFFCCLRESITSFVSFIATQDSDVGRGVGHTCTRCGRKKLPQPEVNFITFNCHRVQNTLTQYFTKNTFIDIDTPQLSHSRLPPSHAYGFRPRGPTYDRSCTFISRVNASTSLRASDSLPSFLHNG